MPPSYHKRDKIYLKLFFYINQLKIPYLPKRQLGAKNDVGKNALRLRIVIDQKLPVVFGNFFKRGRRRETIRQAAEKFILFINR